jgi:tRNA(Arg) A34 adenosine deaminase TadA
MIDNCDGPCSAAELQAYKHCPICFGQTLHHRSSRVYQIAERTGTSSSLPYRLTVWRCDHCNHEVAVMPEYTRA